MTSTTAHSAHVTDQAAVEPTYEPELPEGGTSTQPGALAALCAVGSVRLFRQRGTGTWRALPYLAPGTPTRETAEYLTDLMDDGASIAQVAADTGLSKATVRRAVENLALAYDIEDGDYDDLVEGGLDAIILAADADGEDES
jgi:hypothetical protein